MRDNTELIERLLSLVALSPSVGNAQPWRFVRVVDPAVHHLERRLAEDRGRTVTVSRSENPPWPRRRR